MVNVKATKKISALVPAQHHKMLPDNYDEARELYEELCGGLGVPTKMWEQFCECMPQLIEATPKFKKCMPAIERYPDTCTTLAQMQKQVMQLQNLVMRTCCPSNFLYSAKTTDEISSTNTLPFKEIVTGLGTDYNDILPLQPGKKMRRRIPPRPGYCPKIVRGDFTLANNANNYSDIELELYVSGKSHGGPFWANLLLMKSGNESEYQFPGYKNHPFIVGSLDDLQIEIRNNGPNNLISANGGAGGNFGGVRLQNPGVGSRFVNNTVFGNQSSDPN
ncbi:MAG: hypothetical protein ACPG4T_19620, partial [Nannocystaceae bacterium]